MLKQVIVIRKDLKMRRGKEISQGAHASMKAVLENMNHSYVKAWLRGAFTKIVVCCDSEEEFHELERKCRQNGLIYASIQDNGDTEFGGVPTYTALAIGPAPSDQLEPVTGHLKLR